MAGQCSRISLVMLIIVLISHLSSCSVARRCPGDAIKLTHRSNSFNFFTKAQEEASRDEVHPAASSLAYWNVLASHRRRRYNLSLTVKLDLQNTVLALGSNED
ncbi:hypothetical protein K1719_042889 [Acacia pycnantha]|nr:hypothetical protein K1719_042889 [Acacia pycnantha]